MDFLGKSKATSGLLAVFLPSDFWGSDLLDWNSLLVVTPLLSFRRTKDVGRMTKSDDSAPEVNGENPAMQANGALNDVIPSVVKRVVSDDGGTDEDFDDDEEDTEQMSARKTESQKRRSKKDDEQRGRRGRPNVDDDDNSTGKPSKSRSNASVGSEASSGPKKPKRRGHKSDIIGGDEQDGEEELPNGSFHKLARDSDKSLRSSSKGRKSKRSGSSGSAGKRRSKEKEFAADDYGDEDADELGEEEHEVELKGSGDEDASSGMRQRSLSGGKRSQSSRRGQLMRRSSSERFRRAVDGDTEDEEDRGQSVSRSSHGSTRRRAPSSESLGSGSYHGGSERSSRVRTPNRRPPRRGDKTPNSDESGEDYEHDMNLSGRSSRTLDSIEDLEDFEHIDFQTPGMANYDEEILELMRKANPEHTTQLQRRVGRRREAVNYDQNMPMMTRQALMTRTASSQVQRQFVDQSNLDKRGMMVRSMSNSSMSTDELSMSQHRQQFARAPPSRRPPPRTRSSGMALSRSEHPSDDRRRVFRTKSGASTSSFRQNQKPNRVQSISRRPGEMDTSRSNRGPPEERKGSLARAKSMQATVGRRSTSPKNSERRVPKTVDSKPPRETSREKHIIPKDDDSSISEDSDVESDDDGLAIASPRRKITPIKIAPKPVLVPPKKKTDKRDFTVKRNRSKLHSMLYESKMGVDMHELLETVRRGEVIRSPWKTLVMPSP